MRLISLTEKKVAPSLLDQAYVLVTQPESIDGIEKESLRRASLEALISALRTNGVNDGYQTTHGIEDMYSNLVKSVDATDAGLRVTFWDKTSTDIAIESGGLAFDEIAYDKETGYLHITMNGADVVDPCFIGGGGGSGGTSTVVKLENLTGSASITVAHGESVNISFSYYDYDSAGEFTNSSGALEISVNNETVLAKNIEQGNHTIDIGEYLSEGTNKVKVKVTDEDDNYGTKTWTVNSIALSISATIDDTAINTGPLVFRYTPIGNNIEKTIHFKLDDREIATSLVTASNRQQTQTIPAQSHGSHKLVVYATADVNGVAVTSNVLEYDVIWIEEGNETPIIACSFTGEATQYSTISIPYIVYSPATLTSDITLAINGEKASDLTVDRTAQTWNYKPMSAGTDTLTITCGDTVKTISFKVNNIGISVAPVTTGLDLDLNPIGKTNNDVDRGQFGYIDGQGVNHPLTFSDNFDWTNGGFRTDDDGNTYFCIKCGSSVALDRSLFSDDAMRNGKEIKFVFKATNCRNYDAQIASCMSDGIGVTLMAQRALVKSEQTAMEVPYCEDSLIEMDINVEPDSKNKTMMIWLEGIPSKVAIYASNDNFTQDHPEVLTIGSNDCDVWIYRIKTYKNDLTKYEIHDNWIADAPDAEEMVARYQRNNIYDQNGNIDIQKLINARPNLRVLHIEAERMTTGKKDDVPSKVTHYYKEGGDLHNFTATGVAMRAQGTSSMQYGAAAYNLDLEFINGFNFADGSFSNFYSMTEKSIGVNYFNIKLNVASSENANNVIMADEYNHFQPYLNPARQADPNVRDTVEGHPCAVFFTNTGTEPTVVSSITVRPGETIFYGCGDMNNSKKNFAVFGQGGNPKQCCVEILNNTNNQCLFKLDDLSAEDWSGDYSFEFRYPKKPTEEMKTAWQRVLSWVVSTDTTAATNATLSEAATYNNVEYTTDSVAYRQAKFVAEFEDYFIKDSVLFHYLFTERHSMVDNRAKNVFVSTDDLIHWDFTKDYDNDTADGNDNEGGLTLSYGMEDIDTIGQKDVFNASSSVLWCNVRDLMFADLQALYIRLESNDAWKASRILQKYTDYQSARPEALVIEDMWKKYIMPYINLGDDGYLEMMYGTKADQRRQYETYQEKYIATKYIGSAATSDTITFRAYEPQNWAGVEPSGIITITPYADMYIVIKSGSGTAKKRAKRGTAYPIECPIDTLNDTEIYLYGASNIQDVGDLAPLYVGYFNIASAVKLRSLKLGDGTEGYRNTNATSITLGNNILLERLDIQNCPNIAQALDLTNCHALVTLEAKGSGITGVSFAAGGKIVTAHIPDVASLSARSLKSLADLTFEGFANMRTIRVEDCPTINTLDIVTQATGLTRVRILGIDWVLTTANSNLLGRMEETAGLDESDHNLEQSVLTGAVYVPVVKQSELQEYMAAWSPGLVISYGSLTLNYLVTFKNYDGTVLYTCYVDRNQNAPDPVETGAIPTPTRESSVSTVYTYKGWSKSLSSIIATTEITAEYDETPRQYTVQWISTRGVVLDTQVVDYGSEAVYKGETPTRTEEEADAVYYLFEGWDKSTGFVQSDMEVWAIWQRGELVQQDDTNPIDVSTLTPAQIYAIARNKDRVKEIFSLKDRISIQMGFAPDYTNVPYVDLVSEPIYFDGATAIDTEVQLLKNGISDAWTVVIDCEFDDTTIDQTMVCCMQEDGYMGFKLKYNAGPAIQWSTNTFRSDAITNREIMIIRHIAGDRNVRAYSSKAYSESIGFQELVKSIDTISNCNIVLGATKTDGGEYGNYAKGTLYSCRVWYGDLGDTDCRNIAAWPRETYKFEVAGFGQYKTTENTITSTGIDFICASLLERQMKMNTERKNTGGFDAMPLFTWLQTRMYNAFPQVWRFFMKNTTINFNEHYDGENANIQTADAKIWIPSYIEMQGGTTEPWSYEGEWVTFFVNNVTRIKWRGPNAIPRDGYQRFISSSDPTLEETNLVEEGDVWIDTDESGKGYLRVNGSWVVATYFWLRGASVKDTSNFCYVNASGNVNNGSNIGSSANLSYGVCPRFSI